MSGESVGNDVSALDAEPAEVLDEDRLDADPLEDGMDTAEGYSRDVRLGGTQAAEEQDALVHRLPQEEPDVLDDLGGTSDGPGRPLAATPIDELDESIDDPANSVDGVGGGAVLDPTAPDGAVEDEQQTEVELGLSSEAGGAEPTGLPTDDRVGEAAAVDRENESAEEAALRIEQET